MNNTNYISQFGDITKLKLNRLHAEMDNVWDANGLNNKLPLGSQTNAVAAFYSHPVWILNGLFSEHDPESVAHRHAIASHVQNIPHATVADYGGGSGVLARFIAESSPKINVDIIEPFATDFFVRRLQGISNIRFVPKLSHNYDVVIAQDVLEHVDNPLELAVEIIQATKLGGHLIFANCFHPDIKCHLPATFYLRFTFSSLMRHAGLECVGKIIGAEHAIIYRKIGDVNQKALNLAVKKAKIIGPFINFIRPLASNVKNFFKGLM